MQPFSYQCAFCGEENEILLDESAGDKQVMTEDCAVCCRPNVITYTRDSHGNQMLDVQFEG